MVTGNNFELHILRMNKVPLQIEQISKENELTFFL